MLSINPPQFLKHLLQLAQMREKESLLKVDKREACESFSLSLPSWQPS
jgi:hypothetical protein